MLVGLEARSNDGRVQRWTIEGPSLSRLERLGVSFVNADSMARDAWCNSRAFQRVPSLASKTFVDEVNRRMTRPCN